MFRTRSLMLLVTGFAVLCGAVAADLPRSKSTSGKGVNSPLLKDVTVEGVWEVLSAEKGGEKLPTEISKDIKITFRDEKLIVDILGEVQKGSYKIDGTKRPKRLDLRKDGKTGEGIFVLRGDTLTLCVAEPGDARPTAFTSAGLQMLIVLKRKR